MKIAELKRQQSLRETGEALRKNVTAARTPQEHQAAVEAFSKFQYENGITPEGLKPETEAQIYLKQLENNKKLLADPMLSDANKERLEQENSYLQAQLNNLRRTGYQSQFAVHDNGGAGSERVVTADEVEAAANKYGRTVDYMKKYLQEHGVRIDGNAAQSSTAPAAPQEPPEPQEPPKPKLSAKEMAAKVEASQRERKREWDEKEPERIANVKMEKEGYRVQKVIRLARNGNKGALAELEALARNGNEDAQKELKRLARKQQSEWNGPSR